MPKFSYNPSLTNYNHLRKYYINLAHCIERRVHIESFFGEAITRYEACYAKELSDSELNEKFNQKYSQERYEVRLTPAQQGVTISHYGIYQLVANDDTIAPEDWVMVCEDDLDFIEDFDVRLDQLLKFLNQPKFTHAELVFLHYCENSGFVNYTEPLLDKTHPLHNDGDFKQMVHPSLFESIRLRKHRNSSVFSFEYQNTDTNKPYGIKQDLVCPLYIFPWSACLYLIRKSACQRIVSNNTRPWWIADDFPNLIRTQRILLTSRQLGLSTSEVAAQSTIQDQQTYNNSRKTRLFTPFAVAQDYRARKLNYIPWLKLYYSPYSVNRKLGLMISKFFKLEDKEYALE